MTQIPNAMYTIKGSKEENSPQWSAHVLCTIIGGEGREHGWIAMGYTEQQAINELQEAMRKVLL